MAGFDRKVFSNRLAALRSDRGWSQEDLARESGVSRDAIARYEAEINCPSLETVGKLAEALGCPLDVHV
ncbi:MAG: helix-turn-helix transcriptional regulator [Coriobacteriaceae bacterium]|nr:helix-turn-helix transcriptional regulator [Coriobacteriaceae bacterium]MCI7438552.1 helix-turn-helix transcriptional regulator [Coriobacteriaceae bacterium]MDD7583818.1 helix-turn-helix transcriptional regulator [Coriobacteriaceae bacterium]